MCYSFKDLYWPFIVADPAGRVRATSCMYLADAFSQHIQEFKILTALIMDALCGCDHILELR